jgi:hypothetical protein
MSKRCLLGFLLLFASASAYAVEDGPWSEIRVGDVADNRDQNYDLTLIAVDGSRDVPSESVYELAPGTRSLRLASKKRSESGAITALPYTIELQPCIRYELVADYAQPQANRRWQIVVKNRMPIKSCMKKYGAMLPKTVQIAEVP